MKLRVGDRAPDVVLAAMAAGKRHGRFEGRETQMPAGFVVDPGGGIAFAHYGRDVGDDAPTAALLAAIDSMNASRRRRPDPGDTR